MGSTPKILLAHLHKGCENGCGAVSVDLSGWRAGLLVLTISKLKRSSVSYYIDTAKAAGHATSDLQRANGGLGSTTPKHETRTPVWLWWGMLTLPRVWWD